jgi:hypothetical protein
MDARELKLKSDRIERLVAALLAVVVAAGLWQGYASWLFGGHSAG